MQPCEPLDPVQALRYFTYLLHPVISQADQNAVKLGVAPSQIRIGNVPPAACDLNGLVRFGWDEHAASAARDEIKA